MPYKSYLRHHIRHFFHAGSPCIAVFVVVKGCDGQAGVAGLSLHIPGFDTEFHGVRDAGVAKPVGTGDLQLGGFIGEILFPSDGLCRREDVPADGIDQAGMNGPLAPA